MFLSGQLLGLKENVVKVALGKAHGITLTDKGTVYTFGINNKGQCGRDVFFPKPSGSDTRVQRAVQPIDSREIVDDEIESEDSGSTNETKLCGSDDHRWTVDQCMICTLCGQCTVR